MAIWNLWPFTLFTWPFAWILNTVFFIFIIGGAWVEIAWNSYVFVNFGIDVLLSPYYFLMSFLTVYEALGSRPQYLADLPENRADFSMDIVNFLGIKPLDALAE